MPIMIRLEKRAHKGLPDTYNPVVVCDYCDAIIEDATKANYEWEQGTGDNHPSFADGEKYPVYFLHKECSTPWRQYNRVRGVHFMWEELRIFLKFLDLNLNNIENTEKEA